MTTIRVDPAELVQVAGQLKGEEARLDGLAPEIHRRAASLDWEVGPKADLAEMFAQAAIRSAALAGELASLAQFLTHQAEAYRLADEQTEAILERPLARWGAYARSLGAATWQGAPSGPTASQPPNPEQLRYLQRVLGVQEEGFGSQTSQALQRLHAQYGLAMPPQGQIDPQAWALVGRHLTRAGQEGPPGAPAIPFQPFVPFHQQTDPAYADVRFGTTDTYEKSGCTLTAMAMLVDYHRDSFEATRASMSDLAERTVNQDGNIVWGQADSYLQERFGLRLEHHFLPTGEAGLTAAMSQAHQSLAQGEPVVVGIQHDKYQHWVVIRGYTGEGAPTDPSQFLIHDPYYADHKTLADLLRDEKYRGGNFQGLFRLQERR
jgi:uncharacterized protein YukE